MTGEQIFEISEGKPRSPVLTRDWKRIVSAKELMYIVCADIPEQPFVDLAEV